MRNRKEPFQLNSISQPGRQWAHVEDSDLMPLPPHTLEPDEEPPWKPLSEEERQNYEASLDDTLILDIPKPKSAEEEKELVRKFLNGLARLFQKADNWPFLRPLILTMEHCANCQTCSSACHIYEASGGLGEICRACL